MSRRRIILYRISAVIFGSVIAVAAMDLAGHPLERMVFGPVGPVVAAQKSADPARHVELTRLPPKNLLPKRPANLH